MLIEVVGRLGYKLEEAELVLPAFRGIAGVDEGGNQHAHLVHGVTDTIRGQRRRGDLQLIQADLQSKENVKTEKKKKKK